MLLVLAIVLVTRFASAEPTAVMHVDADDERAVVERENLDHTWSPDCAAPCDLPRDTSVFYRISGKGLVATRSFQLEAPMSSRLPSLFTVRAHMSTTPGRTAGFALTSVGASIGTLGFIAFVGGASDAAKGGLINFGSFFEYTGLVMTGVALGFLIPGVILLIVNRSSATITF